MRWTRSSGEQIIRVTISSSLAVLMFKRPHHDAKYVDGIGRVRSLPHYFEPDQAAAVGRSLYGPPDGEDTPELLAYDQIDQED